MTTFAPAFAKAGAVAFCTEDKTSPAPTQATLREYDPDSGKLVRVFTLPAEFRKPRGIRFDRDNRLYCAGADHVARFDFSTEHFLDFRFQLKRLNGRSIGFVVD
jgi:streptogramin lyase